MLTAAIEVVGRSVLGLTWAMFLAYSARGDAPATHPSVAELAATKFARVPGPAAKGSVLDAGPTAVHSDLDSALVASIVKMRKPVVN